MGTVCAYMAWNAMGSYGNNYIDLSISYIIILNVIGISWEWPKGDS